MKGNARGLLPAVIIGFLLVMAPASAPAETSMIAPQLIPARGPVDLGILFSADNLLLGLSSYQAGLGAKVNVGDLGFRGLLDLVVNGSSQTFLANVGVTVEYHLRPGPISPYIGGYTEAGYTTQTSVSSASTFSVGALAGVEIVIFDFLSVFAEYNLGVDLSFTTDLQTSQKTFDYIAGTRMGNNAKLGIVIYFMRSDQKTK